MIRAAQERAIRKRYRELAPVLDEQGRRRFAASEALALGSGGVSLMARITGLSRPTIYRGISDIRNRQSAGLGRIRQSGGGRKIKEIEDPTLLADLRRLVEPVTRGDPMRVILWTARSLRNLVKELRKLGHKVSPMTVGKLLRGMDYSLQANSKTIEGKQHIDRDAQFEYIDDQAKVFLKDRQPVISCDTKKKELIGNFKNNGRQWRPKGRPELVDVHDFMDPKLKRAVPYGVYDVNYNVGWVSVGTDSDTASFAVNAIRRWWRVMGRKRYPKAKRLMIAADAGGSNGYRTRLWKIELQRLADELKLPITVCHLPPGTSKWNKVEHRLFSFITKHWRGKPLRSYRTVVQLIAATKTEKGLTVRAELDERTYPKGIKVSDAQLAAVNISRHRFHGDWNYTISPNI
jgi:Rhodopirellula transposase DDE domain